jgi:RimJ/RimL family protein N-acetyltransferase
MRQAPPDRLPAFRTARLCLHERRMDDLDACFAMDGEPEMTRFVPMVPVGQPEAHRAFIAARITAAYPPGQGYWSVRRLGDPAFLGWVLLTPLDLRGPEVEIGWRFRRAAWGQGYATEAAAPVLRHALETLGLPEVVADINPANHASCRVAEKIGMRPAEARLWHGHRARRYVARAVAGPAGG